MKKIIAAMMLMATAFAVRAEADIMFEQTDHDFGTIAEQGGPVSFEFEFMNTGDLPLMVLNASASCGCTRPDYPKKPIMPGRKEKIKVTYLPAGRPGEFDKTITVKTNATGKNKKSTLRIRGFVNPEVQPQ